MKFITGENDSHKKATEENTKELDTVYYRSRKNEPRLVLKEVGAPTLFALHPNGKLIRLNEDEYYHCPDYPKITGIEL